MSPRGPSKGKTLRPAGVTSHGEALWSSDPPCSSPFPHPLLPLLCLASKPHPFLSTRHAAKVTHEDCEHKQFFWSQVAGWAEHQKAVRAKSISMPLLCPHLPAPSSRCICKGTCTWGYPIALQARLGFWASKPRHMCACYFPSFLS